MYLPGYLPSPPRYLCDTFWSSFIAWISFDIIKDLQWKGESRTSDSISVVEEYKLCPFIYSLPHLKWYECLENVGYVHTVTSPVPFAREDARGQDEKLDKNPAEVGAVKIVRTLPEADFFSNEFIFFIDITTFERLRGVFRGSSRGMFDMSKASMWIPQNVA